jgi:hypothetical protein
LANASSVAAAQLGTSGTYSAIVLIKSFGSKLATEDAKDNCSKLD